MERGTNEMSFLSIARPWLVLGTIVFMLALVVGCAAKPPASFVQTAEQGWKAIELRPELTEDQAWKIAVDTVGSKYDIETLNKDGGYVRTGWIYTFIQQGTINQNYRSRITVKFDPTQKVCQVKVEAQWLTQQEGWIAGYDQTLLNEAYTDLQGKLGRIVR